MKLYDIVVIDEDEETGKFERTENGVAAHNRQELVNLYAACGSKIRIIREYDDPEDKKPAPSLPPPEKSQLKLPPPPPSPPVPEERMLEQEPTLMPVTHPAPQPQKKVAVEKPPKFFTVAGIECKLDKGKIYQKQWVKLLGQEASNYRLISDKNNRELPFAGKHLEVLKWVLVEDEQSEVNDKILTILNG